MPPTMTVVAGPPGSGKSTAFPVSGFGAASFNADDRAAVLNGGSYTGISKQIREQVNREYAEVLRPRYQQAGPRSPREHRAQQGQQVA